MVRLRESGLEAQEHAGSALDHLVLYHSDQSLAEEIWVCPLMSPHGSDWKAKIGSVSPFIADIVSAIDRVRYRTQYLIRQAKGRQTLKCYLFKIWVTLNS